MDFASEQARWRAGCRSLFYPTRLSSIYLVENKKPLLRYGTRVLYKKGDWAEGSLKLQWSFNPKSQTAALEIEYAEPFGLTITAFGVRFNA